MLAGPSAGVECGCEHSWKRGVGCPSSSPFLMRRFIRKRIEERVASRGRNHVTEADVDESASMYRQYRFK